MKMKSKYFFIIWTLVVVSTFLVVVAVITLWSLNVKVVDNPQFSLPEGTAARLGKGNILGGIQYSPDGAFIAIPSSIGVWLHDADTLKEIYLLTGHTDSAWRTCFSPDGQTLASTEENFTYLWDITTGVRKATLHTPQSDGVVDTVIFSPDGKLLARGIRKGQVEIWDAQTGHLKKTFLRPSDSETNYSVSSNIIAFSQDGQTLASISEGHTTLYLWNVETGTHITHRIGSSRTSLEDTFTFSPEGGMLATLNDRTISLWDVATGTHKKDINITGNRYFISNIYFRPNGQTLVASGQLDYYLWDVDTGEQINFTNVEKSIACISPDEKTWVLRKTIDNITYIQLWDVAKAKPKKTIQWLSGGHPVLFSPDRKTLISGAKGYINSANLNLWNFDFYDVERITHRTTLTSDIYGHYSLRFGRNEKRLMQIGKADGNLWNIGSLTLKDEFGRTTEPNFAYEEINPVSIISDKRAVIRTRQGFGLWDFVAGNYELIPVNDHRWDNPESLCFSPDGKTLATGRLNGVELWDVGTGTHKMSLAGHEWWDVVSVCFSPDGKVLASGGGSGRALRDPPIRGSEPPTIRLWDVTTGKHIATFKGHSSNVAALVFSPNGKFLASGDWRKIHLWDIGTGELKGTFHGHKDYVTSLIFSPYGQFLASGESGTTLLWDIRHISGFVLFL